MPSLFKKKVEPTAPHLVRMRKLSDAEIRKSAINEGMAAVKRCHPGITIGDIMQLELEMSRGRKLNKHAKELLGAYRKAANDFCEKEGRERLF